MDVQACLKHFVANLGRNEIRRQFLCLRAMMARRKAAWNEYCTPGGNCVNMYLFGTAGECSCLLFCGRSGFAGYRQQESYERAPAPGSAV